MSRSRRVRSVIVPDSVLELGRAEEWMRRQRNERGQRKQHLWGISWSERYLVLLLANDKEVATDDDQRGRRTKAATMQVKSKR